MTDAQITIATADGLMPAFVATPDEAAKGAVVVVQEAFGVTAHIEDVTRRLAAAGWLGIAPAFFHRQGSPVIAYDDLAAVMPVMSQVTADGVAADLTATFTHLAGEGFAAPSTAVVGFCMGGSVALYAAALFPLGAAVTFYGGGLTAGRLGFPPLLELAPTLQTPWLGLFGDQDQGIPVDDVESLRTAAAGAPAPTDIVRYAEAQHGFHCDDRPAVFDPAAAADAWARTLAWFDQYVTPPAAPTSPRP